MKLSTKKFASILRLGLSLSILACLFYKVDFANAKNAILISFHHKSTLFYGLLCGLACFSAGAVRWKVILDFHGLKMNCKRVFAIYSIGLFFNNFMFGSTGGDLARAFYAARQTHHKKAEAVATIIVDRLFGLIVMAITAGIMIIVQADFFRIQWETRLAAGAMTVMLLILLLGLLFLFNIYRLRKLHVFRPLKRYQKFSSLVERLVSAIAMTHRHTRLIGSICLISAIALFFAICEWYFLGKSFRLELSFLDYLTFIPLVMCLSAVPVSPGGLGVREGLAVVLLGAMAVTTAQALPLALLVYLISILWSLPGGLMFLIYSEGTETQETDNPEKP